MPFRLKGIWVVAFFVFTGQASALASISKNYGEVKAFLAELVVKHPQHASIFELGPSDMAGEKILGLKLGNGPIKNLIVGTHHGNEYGSTEVAKGVAASLAESPISGQTLFVIPVLNISGFNAGERRESAGGSTYDANRDYPGPCGTEGPFKLKSTQALADFINREGIIASATLHTYWPVVVYPWGISTHDLSTPYDDQYKQLVQAATVESHYQTGNNTTLIYPADGTFEDYAYWKHGIWSLLFELGFSHSPSQSAVDEMVRVNTPGIRRFLEQAPRTRAEKHDFTGKCDLALRALDRHDE